MVGERCFVGQVMKQVKLISVDKRSQRNRRLQRLPRISPIIALVKSKKWGTELVVWVVGLFGACSLWFLIYVVFALFCYFSSWCFISLYNSLLSGFPIKKLG